MTQAARHKAATRPDGDDPVPALRLRSDAEEDREPTTDTPGAAVDEDMLVIQMSAKAAAHGLETKEDRAHRQEVQRLGVQLLQRLFKSDDPADMSRALRVLIKLHARSTDMEVRRLEVIGTALEANSAIRCAQIRERTARLLKGEVAKEPTASPRGSVHSS